MYKQRERKREIYLKWLIECRSTDGKQIGLGDHTAMEKKSQLMSRAIRIDNKWNIKCLYSICIFKLLVITLLLHVHKLA